MPTTITIYKTEFRKPLLGLLPLWLAEVDNPDRHVHETNIPTPWLLSNPVETVVTGLRQSNPNAIIRVRESDGTTTGPDDIAAWIKAVEPMVSILVPAKGEHE